MPYKSQGRDTWPPIKPNSPQLPPFPFSTCVGWYFWPTPNSPKTSNTPLLHYSITPLLCLWLTRNSVAALNLANRCIGIACFHANASTISFVSGQHLARIYSAALLCNLSIGRTHPPSSLQIDYYYFSSNLFITLIPVSYKYDPKIQSFSSTGCSIPLCSYLSSFLHLLVSLHFLSHSFLAYCCVLMCVCMFNVLCLMFYAWCFMVARFMVYSLWFMRLWFMASSKR